MSMVTSENCNSGVCVCVCQNFSCIFMYQNISTFLCKFLKSDDVQVAQC